MDEQQARLRCAPAPSEPTLFLRNEVEIVWRDAKFHLAALDGSVAHPLTPIEALALLVLGRFGSIESADRHLLPLGPAFSAALRQVVHRYPTYLGPGRERPFDAAWWGEKLPHVDQRSAGREAAPASVTWLVTLECNRRCPYCFYKIIPVADGTRRGPQDSMLSTARSLEVVAELARIGTADLYLTGGEPLLRDDVPDLIAAASGLGIRTHIVTKYAIDRALAWRLAGSRLSHITISLDDIGEASTLQHTGVRSYRDEALAAIGNCLAVGLDVEVNAVLTAFNCNNLEILGATLADLSVPRFTISPLQEPYFRNANIGRLVTTCDVDAAVRRVRAAVGGRIAVGRGGASTSEQGKGAGCAPDLVCEVGSRSLHILPNGDVTRCHYLPGRADLIIGSLQQSTIMEIWNGRSLAAFVAPASDDFIGTACHGCGGFQKCNSRGRCVASAILEHEKVFAPDAFCSRGE
jgi:pyrroloquinoline quinone biosynthesis protein E